MFLFAAALMMVACSNEEIATNDDVQYVSELKLNFGKGDSRVAATHSAAGLKFAWEEGDAIEVWEDLNDSGSRKIFEYDATEGCFKPQNDSDENKVEVGKKYFAVTASTGYWISVEGGKSVVPMELKGGRGLGELPMITDVFEATAENTTATMHHTVGVIEIPVKATVSGVKLQTLGLNSQTANLALRGEFNISPEAPYTLSSTYGYFDSYNQTSTDTPIELKTSEATSIFIPAFPGTYSTLDIKYTLEGGTEQTKTAAYTNVTVERGKITKLSEQTLE